MLTFDINNQRKIYFEQAEHDNTVFVETIDSNGKLENGRTIPAGQFIMLYNLYVYIIENDIKNSFINPYGKNIINDL